MIRNLAKCLCLAMTAIAAGLVYADAVSTARLGSLHPKNGVVVTNVDFTTSNTQLVATVGQIVVTNLITREFDPNGSYVRGETVVYGGKVYRANRSMEEPHYWYDYAWDEVTTPEDILGGSLYQKYLPLGYGGYVSNKVFMVRIAASPYGGVSYMHGTEEGYLGVYNTYGGKGVYLTPEGHVKIVRDDVHYNTYDLNMMIYGGNILPITYANVHSDAPLVVSPKYVYQYLTNNYFTASEVSSAISNAGHVPNTRTVNGKALSADVVLLPADIGTLSEADIADAIDAHKPLRVYGDEGYTNYIDGARGYYVLLPPTLCYTNAAGVVYAPAEENYLRPPSGDTYLRKDVDFSHYYYYNGSTEVITLPVPGGLVSTSSDYFYDYSVPSGWLKVGTLALHQTVPNNITRTATDATLVHCDDGTCTNAILYIRQASHTLAGLMTAADKADLDAMKVSMVSRETVTNLVNEVKELHYDEVLNVTWETRMVGGEMKLYAVTNADISVLH